MLRFATELIPATFAILGAEQISPFWAVIFYFVLILFGIAQQLAIWHCVITGIIAIRVNVLKSWETTITFFSCACGFVLGLPMTTEVRRNMLTLFAVGKLYLSQFPVGHIRGVFSGRYRGWVVVVDLGDSPANRGGFHGTRKTLQWRHRCDSALQHLRVFLHVELGSSAAVVHVECCSSCGTNGRGQNAILNVQ